MSEAALPPAPIAAAGRIFPAIGIHALTVMAFLAASTAPTPLYRLYQAEWHFSSVLLTVIFAVYALALLSALLVAGGLSDHIGRRPVITLALILEIGSMGLFIAASDPGWLIAARILQGIATGLATAAIGAALIDLHHEHGALTNGIGPMIGMALGALGATALSQMHAGSLELVFEVLLAVFVLQLILTWTVPETARKRHGAWRSLIPSVAIPAAARATLLAISPLNISFWMLGGFLMSLMPSLIAAVTGSNSIWLGGLCVSAMTLSGGIALYFVRRLTPDRCIQLGGTALLLGGAAILVGINAAWPVPMLGGCVLAGAGFGSGFLGSVRSLMPLGAPEERAALMATFYMESYLAFSLPAIAGGFLAQHFGLLTAANIYGATVMLLALTGFTAFLILRKRAAVQAAPRPLR